MGKKGSVEDEVGTVSSQVPLVSLAKADEDGAEDGLNQGPEVPPGRLRNGFWRPGAVRLQMALLLCGAYTAIGLMRINMAMAIVCMVNQTALDQLAQDTALPSSNASTPSPAPSAAVPSCQLSASAATEYSAGAFVWSSSEQAAVFAAYFWGGFVGGFPGGLAADRFGAKRLIALAVGLSAVGSLLTPLVAVHFDWIGLCALRFLIGLTQGIIDPVNGAMAARWHPATEKASVSALVTGGNQISALLVLPLTSLLCKYSHWWDGVAGWPSVFYLPALLSLLLLGLWWLGFEDSPDKCSRISRQELAYIRQELGERLRKRREASAAIPWRALLSSPPLIAAALNNVSLLMNVGLLAAYVPTYFKDVLYLDLASNGLLSALPFLVLWVSKTSSAALGDRLKKRSGVSHIRLCKAFNSVAAFGCPVCLIGLGWVDCSSRGWAVGLLCLNAALRSGFTNGAQTSALNIAPQFSGLVASFCRVVGQTGIIAMPYLVGGLVREGRQDEWRRVFLVMAAVMAFGGIAFLLFGSVAVQPWAKPKVVDKDQDDKL